MRVKISDILKATGGKLLCGDEAVAVTSFFTDSRQAKAGAMFVPIRGERADGHDYIPAVLESPAAATFTDHEIPLGEKPIVLVKDCREALQKAAAWYREQFAIPVVGVTGSVGKTTAKEMVAQALTAKFRVLKTAGNQNSQVGVPITVCGLKKDHTAAVVEMGVSMPGEMARIAAVVNIADYIPVDGALFVNGDDDLLPTLKETLGGKVVTFGLGPTCDWRAYGLNEADKGTFFTCLSPAGEKTEVFVPAAGYLGVPAEDAVRAISAYKAPAMRQQVVEAGGLLIIDDSYNASPDSMRSAIDVLATRPVTGKRAAVLADMLELGDFSQQGHYEVGSYARERGVELLVAVGPLAKGIAAGYGSEAHWFATNEEATAFLQEALRPGDAVLVKGSRGMRTDEIVAALTAGQEA